MKIKQRVRAILARRLWADQIWTSCNKNGGHFVCHMVWIFTVHQGQLDGDCLYRAHSHDVYGQRTHRKILWLIIGGLLQYFRHTNWRVEGEGLETLVHALVEFTVRPPHRNLIYIVSACVHSLPSVASSTGTRTDVKHWDREHKCAQYAHRTEHGQRMHWNLGRILQKPNGLFVSIGWKKKKGSRFQYIL